MAAQLYYSPFIPAFSPNGLPVPGAFLYFYYSQTNDLAPIYGDESLTVPIGNPVQADLAARFPDVYLDSDIVYRVRLTDNSGTPLGADIDPYLPGEALRGPPGAPDNSYDNLLIFKASDTTKGKATLLAGTIAVPGDFFWTPGNYTGQADDLNVIKADSTPLSVGAWVRQGADGITFKAAGASAVARTQQDKSRDTVSIKDFGGVGDNSTDNSTAISSAMAYLASRGGGILHFPAGAYKTSQPIEYGSDSITLSGDGRKTTYLAYTGTVGPFFRNDAKATRYYCGAKGMQISASSMTSSRVVMSLGFHNNFVLQDCWIVGVATANCWGVYFGAYNGTTIDDGNYNLVSNCYFGPSQIGVRIDSGSNSNTIENCRFQLSPAGAAGVQIIRAGPATVSNVNVTGCIFEYIGIASLGPPVTYLPQSMTGVAVDEGDSITISGNRFEYQIAGVNLATNASNVTLNGNYFEGCIAEVVYAGSALVRLEKGAVNFGQSSLKYYQEGSFTPTLQGSTGDGSTTYINQIGRYTRIGNTVFVEGYIAWSATTATGAPRIGGLPFPALNVPNLYVPINVAPDNYTYSGKMEGIVFASMNYVSLYVSQPDSALTPAAMDSSAGIRFAGTYMV